MIKNSRFINYELNLRRLRATLWEGWGVGGGGGTDESAVLEAYTIFLNKQSYLFLQ